MPFGKLSNLKKVVAGVILGCVVGAGAGWWFLTKNAKAPEPELSGIVQEMRKNISLWTKAEKDVSSFLQDARDNKVAAVGLALNGIAVANKDNTKYFVVGGYGVLSELVVAELRNSHGTAFQMAVLPTVTLGKGKGQSDGFIQTTRDIVGILYPFLIIGGLLYYMRRELLGGAKLVEDTPKTKFSDVIGASEAKSALTDIVSYLKEPDAFTRLGAKPPRGVLMTGGPGTGKTMLARALAGECGAKFIATNGSEFTSKFYGVGIQKVKHLFEMARKNAPSIVFIDEIDGIGMRTHNGWGPGEAESNRIINQILIEMDGFASNEGVIVVGATNFAESLDKALVREGRFDRRVHVKLPDVKDRAELFKLYAKTSGDANVDFEQLARMTTGLSPATIEYIANHAALLAARNKASVVTQAHFMEAIEVARIGEVNGSQRALTAEDRHRVAVHEAGHAIVAAVLNTGNVEKVTILPRGNSLGVTLVTQAEDKHLHLQSELENQIQVLLGGRNAELLTFKEASSGAAQDLQEASRLALDMVGKLGFGADGSLFSIGALPSQHMSEHLSTAIEQSNALLKSMDDKCRTVLTTHSVALEQLTNALLAEETVSGETVRAALESTCTAA